jgi:hypothetical protein
MLAVAEQQFVKLISTAVRERRIAGPVTQKIYYFNPWNDEVDSRDAEQFRQVTVSSGCSCSSNYRKIPIFATEEEYKTKRVVPAWEAQ